MGSLTPKSSRSRIAIGVALLMVIIIFSCLTWIDQTPYQQKDHYAKMVRSLDSLESLSRTLNYDSLKVGWAKTSLTPFNESPLAGYGNRSPKKMLGIKDSVFVRTIVIHTGTTRLAILSFDLLIVPPEVKKLLGKRLKKINWSRHQVYLTATHTHSSIGGWAKGWVGELFAGQYSDTTAVFIADQAIESLKQAQNQLSSGSMSYAEIALPHLVKNRLVRDKGIVDPWLKLLTFSNDTATCDLVTFSAHPTCLDSDSRVLSGDYPAGITSGKEFRVFCAGPMASMGTIQKGQDGITLISNEMSEQIQILKLLGLPDQRQITTTSYHIPLYLDKPQIKVSASLCLRPWLAGLMIEDYDAQVSIAQINDIILIGIPGEFSGELAIPLYEEARKLGLNLIITSFNGGYTGYIPNDSWYNLNRYETRRMSWFGPYYGSYMSEVIRKIIEIHAQYM